MQPTKHWVQPLGLIGLSLFIHAGAFVSTDQFFRIEQVLNVQKIQKEKIPKNEKLEFEFVEAPAEDHPAPIKPTRKISNRNAVNRDLEKDKTLTTPTAAPKIQKEGVGDQLAQLKGAPAPVSVEKPEVQPVKEVKSDVIASEPKQSKPESEIASSTEKESETPRNDEPMKNPVPQKEETEPKVQKEQTPSKAAPALKGLTGQDKITTQEIARSKSFGAEIYGATSFEATGSGMGEYMKNLKEKIWLAWFPYLVFKYPQDFHPANAVISMTLNANGDVTILKILEQDGSDIFGVYCLDAIQRSANFGPVPPEVLALIGKDELEIKFGFHYR